MNQIKKFIKKYFTKELILYGIFGVLTTVVNLVVFFVLSNIFHLEENISNAISIVVAILFAYFTNRKIVFNSIANSMRDKLIEFGRFIIGRSFSMLVELVGFFLMFNILHFQEFISKIIISIIVIILNFFISKFFAFKK